MEVGAFGANPLQVETMNWRRGLFRLWIVGTALFVLAVAFFSYSEIKAQFDAIAAKHLHELHRQHLWHRRGRATALNAELVGIGPMCVGRHGFDEQIFGADEQDHRS